MTTRQVSSMDPFDFDTYFLQRMAEFFGPDFGTFIQPSVSPIITSSVAARAGRPTDWTETATSEPEKTVNSRQAHRMARQTIPVDISETDDGYVVEASLPGVPKDHIDVTIDHNNVLTVSARAVESVVHACGLNPPTSGNKQGEISTPQESPTKESRKTETPSSNLLLSERQKGEMRRSVRLPKYADPQQVKSCIENGVLCLFFAKLPSSQIYHKIEQLTGCV